MKRFEVIDGQRVLLQQETREMIRGLYAIVDTLAADLIGNLNAITVQKHEATAVRFFGDVAKAEGTFVHQHIEDCALLRLGYLDDDNNLVPDKAVVITGVQWRDAQQPEIKP